MSRSFNVLRVTAAFAALLMVFAATMAARPHQDGRDGASLMFVGTYTGGKTGSEGIYAFRVRRDARGAPAFEPLGLAAATDSPSFLAVDERRGLLFAVNETDVYAGKPTGSVSAYTIDRASGRLTLINRQPSLGRAPCHLTLDKDGRYLLVANYSSGTVAVLPVAADGRLGEPRMVQHTGSSVNRQRQEAPHAHCTNFDPAYRFFFACDLGIDKVMAYRFDAAAGVLTPHTPPSIPLAPGSGPRHMAFTPDGRFAYVLNELTSSVTAFTYDAAKGSMTELQTLSTLPEGHRGANSGAEITVHPSGRFLYSSNRGHDSIALFRIDERSGRLTFVSTTHTGGRTPRHFAVSPDGALLLAANQESGSIVPFSIDPDSGALRPAGSPVKAPAPVCIVMMK